MVACVLSNWRLDCRYDGSIYCIGDTPSGVRWETTQILALIDCRDHYVVTTRNSTYILYR